MLPGDGVVHVAAGGGPAAAGCGAPGVAGADHVAEFPVARYWASAWWWSQVPRVIGVIRMRSRLIKESCGRVPGGGSGPGAGGRAGAGEPSAGAGRRVLAGCAAVGGGGAVGVQRSDAPPGARVPGRRGGQVPGVGRVDDAEPADLRWGVGLAWVSADQRHGDGDQRGQAGSAWAAGAGAGAGSGTPWAAAAARAAVPVAGAAGARCRDRRDRPGLSRLRRDRRWYRAVRYPMQG